MAKTTKKSKRRVVVQLGFTRSGLALLARSLDVAIQSGQLNAIDQNEAKALWLRVSEAYDKLVGITRFDVGA